MTDIVERLRLALSPYKAETRINVIADAADEIERLRAKIKESGPQDDWEERGAADEYRAEIERLRARVQELERLHNEILQLVMKQIERRAGQP